MKEDTIQEDVVDSAPDFDVAASLRFLQEKRKKRTLENRDRLTRAREDFDKIVAMLIELYHPERIFQWGSLLNEKNFSGISDIDVAIEGDYTAEEFFRMYGQAMDLTRFPLDLVEMNRIDPLHAESIRKKGRKVYERRSDSCRTDR
ncbi:MAG: nucleotidyltransferase domain-containing protein [Proteobacteria bacterium]|nr:nucleotidyltransferase domain-containing protein [Pseudomonadota bacterium]